MVIRALIIKMPFIVMDSPDTLLAERNVCLTSA